MSTTLPLPAAQPVEDRAFDQGAPITNKPILVAAVLRPRGETGVQTHFNTLIRSARQINADVRLVTPFDLPAALVYPAFGPGRALRPLSRSFWVWWHRESHRMLLRHALQRQLRRDEPAIVYAQDPVSATAALQLRDRGFPLEVTMAVHFNISQANEWAQAGCIDPDKRLFRRIRAQEAEVFSAVDRLIFPSQYMRHEVTRNVPAARNVPARCIPNFVSPSEAVAPSGRPRELISIGTLEPRKNQSFLLRVLAEAHARGRRYRLTLVGDGPDRAALQALAADLGLRNHVHFAGMVHGAARLIADHRAYVHAAQIENLPISLLEALAAGRPVFAAPVGGIPEVFTSGTEGYFWSLNDPSGAADQLIAVLESCSVYGEMAAAARRRYLERFTPDAIVPELLRAIDPSAVPAGTGQPDPGGRG